MKFGHTPKPKSMAPKAIKGPATDGHPPKMLSGKRVAKTAMTAQKRTNRGT